jgi:hypothetical protein
MQKKRTFTIASSCINVNGGRYNSLNPMSAAKKAATQLFKKAKKSRKYKSLRKITFCLRETTISSDKLEYHYKAARMKLDKPIIRIIDNKEIVNHYRIEISATADKHQKNSLKCEKMQNKKKGGYINNDEANEINNIIEQINNNNPQYIEAYITLFDANHNKLLKFTRDATFEQVKQLSRYIHYFVPNNANFLRTLQPIFETMYEKQNPSIARGPISSSKDYYDKVDGPH